jgi:hypothetical protein
MDLDIGTLDQRQEDKDDFTLFRVISQCEGEAMS